ncbi:hypothetical protein BsWGS_01169 [Bradybaena similaris]
MPRTSSYQFVASILLAVLSIRAVRYVIVPDVYTTVEEDTVIKCHIMFKRKAPLFSKEITFEMVGTSLRCDITDWYTCPRVFVDLTDRPANFSCGCLTQEQQSFYTFYLYLQSCPMDLANTRYRCIPSFAVDQQADGQLRVIDFSKKPALQILKCEGESVRFDWEYNPYDYESHLSITHISWLFYPTKGQPMFIGTFKNKAVYRKDRVQFGKRASIKVKPLKETIPFLEVKSLQRDDSGTFMIEIVFLSLESRISYTDRDSPSFLNAAFGASMDVDVQDYYDYDNYTDLKPTAGDRWRAGRRLRASGASDDSELRQKADDTTKVSRQPVLLGDFLDKVQPTLRSSTTLHIVEPLPENVEIVFKKMRRSNEIFLYCSMLSFSENTSFDYISFVIQHGDRVMASSQRQSFLLLKLNKDSPMHNYTCEITGYALQCDKKKLPQNRKLRMEIDNLLKDEIVPVVVERDFTFMGVMYLLQGITCVILMLWNCILMAKHVGFLCSRRLRREQEKLQAVESLALERKSVRESVNQQRKISKIVLPPKASGGKSTAAVSPDLSSRNDTPGLSTPGSNDVSTDQVSESSWIDETDNSSKRREK